MEVAKAVVAQSSSRITVTGPDLLPLSSEVTARCGRMGSRSMKQCCLPTRLSGQLRCGPGSHIGKHPRCCVCRVKMSSAGSSVMQQASELLLQAPVLPKVLVLDLDYTVWPYWCEMYGPRDDPPDMYPEAMAIIDACRQHKLIVAAASRTPTPHVAQAFMKKLGLDQRFDNIQLIPAADGADAYSAQKDRCHLPNIKAATGHEYADMLFFDDEQGNVNKVSRLGVCSVLVPTRFGLCLQTFREGLEKYASQHQR